MAVWRGITISFLAGGIVFLFLAGLMGTRTQDVWIHDKYLVSFPATYVLWQSFLWWQWSWSGRSKWHARREGSPMLNPILFSALYAIASLPPSQPLGAVVQTWHYDPVANLVTLQIVNTSHKDITAFNIAIKETYADGRVEQHEMLEDFVGKILAAKELQGDQDLRGQPATFAGGR
jgi:hypothetical protein